MSSVNLASATLLCRESVGVSSVPESAGLVTQDLVVAGIEVPGSAPILHRDLQPDSQLLEWELQWPRHMVDELASFYDEYYAHESDLGWNCHTFATRMTGVRDHTELTDDGGLANARIGDWSIPSNLENGRRYGVVSWTGKIVHSLVATQKSTHSLNVTGFRKALRVNSNESLRSIYVGDIHSYRIKRTAGAVLQAAGRGVPL
jgi:hypothetical protein